MGNVQLSSIHIYRTAAVVALTFCRVYGFMKLWVWCLFGLVACVCVCVCVCVC